MNHSFGFWCGYVELPKSHPFHNKSYTDPYCGHTDCRDHSIEGLIDVHGGLTYGSNGRFGFDCGHYRDISPFNKGYIIVDEEAEYRDKEYVIKQTNSMAEQFYKYRTKKYKPRA